MRELLYILTSILFLCSCSHIEESDPALEDKGIYITFQDRVETRSSLNSSYVNYRKVKEVYLYVFEGTGSTSKCVLIKELKWNGEISQKYALGEMLNSGTYTFMAVGIDDKAGTTYNFPNAIVLGSELGASKAQLVEAKRADMPGSDLYVGLTEASVSQTASSTVNIELKRKVSGVLAYLKNIPCTVNGTTVSDLKIKLHRNQHTQIPLITSTANPYGSGVLANSAYLFERNLLEYFPDKKSGKYYVIPAENTSDLKTVENSLLMGAFMLPLEASTANKSTLSIELWGTDAVSSQYKILKSYDVTYKKPDGTETNVFDIDENHLYSIGRKPSDDDTSGDKPMDLSGSGIEVFVTSWDNYNVDNNFPIISVPARMRVDYNPTNYIFDCKSTVQGIIIDASYPSKPWTLKIPDDCDWIHFVQKDADGFTIGYTRTISGEGYKEIEIILNDYAIERSTTAFTLEEIKTDYRSTDLQLITLGDATVTTTLSVRQYNAITVDNTNHVGISRLDYGCYFDKETGAIVRPANAKLQWGYFSTGNLYVSGDNPMEYYNGETNLNKIYKRYTDGKVGGKYYVGSMFQKVRQGVITITNGVSVPTGNLWYPPVYHELWSISEAAVRMANEEAYSVFGLAKNERYWSGSGHYLTIGKAYYALMGTNKTDSGADKNDAYWVRPARHF
nr:MAG TPA: putative polysaccharide binding protein [Caudoviricetes sp.]